MPFTRARLLMLKGLEERVFTAAVLLVARSDTVLLHEPFGTVGGVGTPPVTAKTLFDVASLTKILATTPCWMLLASQDPEILDEPLARWFPSAPEDKKRITPRQLLNHSSGLPAWRPYYLFTASVEARQRFTLEKILAEPLHYAPGRGCVYSDLGFILLGFMLGVETGEDLEAFSRDRIFQPLGLADDLVFRPREQEGRIAHTRADEPPGIVNDLNARALGGVAGHAGLFGTAQGAAGIAGRILMSLKSLEGPFDQVTTGVFCSRTGPENQGVRPLGFDKPSSEGSSSGRFFSSSSLGHTGFTGTSLWIDPATDLIVVLLTNRVFMGESDFRIKAFRPQIHDALIEEVAGSSASPA